MNARAVITLMLDVAMVVLCLTVTFATRGPQPAWVPDFGFVATGLAFVVAFAINGYVLFTEARS